MRKLILILAVLWSAQAQDGEFFEKRVRPLLAAKCYSCHTTSKLGGLRLDSRSAMLDGGKSGPAIVPGKPSESLLIRAVTHADEKLKMPMAGDRLSEREVAELKQWIEQGAVWPEAKIAAPAKKGFQISPEQRAFWAFQPIQKPAPPAVKNAEWAASPIDRFVLAKLEEKRLSPVKPADKRVLIRRASYDLTGLPPTPEQVEAFLADNSAGAFAKGVDWLLASPHYGERWARHWLDVARYADGDGPDRRPVFIGYGMAKDGYVNTFRYRDWVIQALNRDLPYDLFVKAQIAADLLPGDKKDLLPGLGFFGIGPCFTGDDVVFVEARSNERDDKIDALSKGFLGLTITCARCHDHKYDPISQKDYTAMAGVFASSGYWEYDLAPKEEVAHYKAQWKKVKEQEAAIKEYMEGAAIDVAEHLAARTANDMMLARKVLLTKSKPDSEILARWMKYLSEPEQREHPFLREWDRMMASGGESDSQARQLADALQKLVFEVIAEKRKISAANDHQRRNYRPDPNEQSARLPGDLMQFELFQFKQSLVQTVMDTHKFYVWLDIVQGEQGSQDYRKKDGIYEYRNDKLLPHLDAGQKARLDAMRAELAAIEKATPKETPYLMGLAEEVEPVNLKLQIRGNAHALGETVHRGFPAILAKTGGDPLPFAKGSGRLELAEAIVRHPLAARVMANRIWMHHFGRGIVATPSNFGVTGERPTHPELLDYLAARFIENGWSMKALHREIMLSATYQLSARPIEPNETADPDNKLFWRANLRRLEAESLRDSLLFVSGALDERPGGPPHELSNLNNKKRTVYGRIRRGGPDRILQLFDFPDPTISGDQRSVTNVPLQNLFFLNSELVWQQADLLAKRVAATSEGDDRARIHRAYRLLYGRDASGTEVQIGLDFLKDAQASASPNKPAWQQYAQVLLSSGAFHYIN